MIDQLGDEKVAIAWLVAEKKVAPDLPVRDFKLSPRFGDMTFLRTATSVTFDALGLFALVEMLLFMATVFVAYGYVWRRGGLSWD